MPLGSKETWAKIKALGNNAPKEASSKPWFRAESKDENVLDVMIFDAIDSWFGVDAQEVVAELRAFKGDTIKVSINSPGGDVFAGMAIYNALKEHSAKVEVSVDGMAASIASVIALAGDEKPVMKKGTRFMIHNAWSFAAGDHRELRSLADVLEGISNELAELYAEVSGQSLDEVKAKMDAETYFSATEARMFGLAFDENAEPEPKSSEESLAIARAEMGKKMVQAKLAVIAANQGEN